MKVKRLSYVEARTQFQTHPMRVSEIPVEYAISLPIPTLRYQTPGYGGFAGAARRAPNQPLELRPPDRWWVLSADRRGLLAYSLVAAVPFSNEPSGQMAVRPPADRSVAAIQEDLRLLDALMDRAAGDFFAARPAGVDLATDLIAVLSALVPKGAVDWYRRLAYDFFDWLAASAAAIQTAGIQTAGQTAKESKP
jgi:hypothetical protein